MSEIFSTVTGVKGVASPSLPIMDATFPMRHSTSWPIVMREGIAWGFTMMSGEMPSHVNGMSSCVYVMPTVPFCPWRDENLSPTCGVRTDRTLILTNFSPWSLVVSNTWSMMPVSEFFMPVLQSRLVNRLDTAEGSSSGSGLVLPMIMSSPDTRVPGHMRPSSSSLSYVPCRIPNVVSRVGRSSSSLVRDPCFFSSSLKER
mmetsp:Transcript_29662/g.73496  ORF Transcript_29662/g.73496 Transcript_29662/m.73496 type:complete len:201 (-) Transcript_29662:2653-3255(-)